MTTINASLSDPNFPGDKFTASFLQNTAASAGSLMNSELNAFLLGSPVLISSSSTFIIFSLNGTTGSISGSGFPFSPTITSFFYNLPGGGHIDFAGSASVSGGYLQQFDFISGSTTLMLNGFFPFTLSTTHLTGTVSSITLGSASGTVSLTGDLDVDSIGHITGDVNSLSFQDAAGNKFAASTGSDDPNVHLFSFNSLNASSLTANSLLSAMATNGRFDGDDNITLDFTFGANFNAGTGNDTVNGGRGNDSLFGDAGNDTLSGGAGNDALDGGVGNDSMAGGIGNDSYTVDSSSDAITEAVNGGTDLVNAPVSYVLGANVENLTLTGAANIDGTGNGGNNVLTGNSGANTLTGGLGNDTYVIDPTDTIVENPGEGSDTVVAGFSYTLAPVLENLALAGTGDIDATGNGADNKLTGNSGDNVLDGRAGNDAMAGGDGDDTYVVNDAGDTVTEAANQGDDTVLSSVSFTLGANVESLTLTGSASIDGTGSAQANVLEGNRGANVLAGGGGNDLYIVGAGDSVVEGMGGGTDAVLSALNFTLGANVENLLLSGNARMGFGNAQDNVLIGNGKNNTLDGGAGNDVLDGGTGFDTLVGGAGMDTYLVDSAADRIVELAGGGVDTVHSSSDYYRLGAEVENLSFDTGAANQGFGNELDNLLTGNTGNDTLAGGLGNDRLAGGAGADTFVFDTAPGAGNVDTITDFVSGSDELRFESTIFGALGAEGALAAGAFHSGNFTSGQDADDRLVYNTTTGALYYDADGSGAGAAVQVAVIAGHPALLASDIEVS